MRTLVKRFRDSRLSVKIISLFSVVLLAITVIMLGFFAVAQRRARYTEFDRIARQNTQLIANNIDAMLMNASFATKMVIANATVQQTLTERRSLESPAVVQELRLSLGSLSYLQPYTAGLYLFNTIGQRFGMDNYTLRSFSFRRLEDAPWYEAAEGLRGYYMTALNGGEDERLFGDENVVSVIRVIYDLNRQADLVGAVMLNMREAFLVSCFEKFEAEYQAEVAVVDDEGRSLLTREQPLYAALTNEQRARLMLADADLQDPPVMQGGHVSYSAVTTRNAPWHVIVALPYAAEVSGVTGARNLFALLVAMEALLIFSATVMITRMVTRPLSRLTRAMSTGESEHPARVEMDCADDEIGVLKDTYNSMVDRIEKLFQRIGDESERKRQAEFHALQAQINPHFLYNTIDTARGLALMGRADDVNRLLRNLGEFYRNSINNGRNIITLREEIHMVQSYLDIQKIRYEAIRTVYDVDESLLDARIPKLVLQPLAENALYHGLRPAGNKGTISLRVWAQGDVIYVSVADDGVGIDPAVIARVFDPSGEAADRFGLKGTIDRLRLFYRQERVLSIERETGRGTRMTLMIPRDFSEEGEA